MLGPVGLGLLRAGPAVGAALMAFGLARWPIQRNTGIVMFAAVAIFGVATIVFGVSHSFYVSLAALAILGAADMISVFVRSALIQYSTPDHMRGRVSAVSMLFIGASNELGEFESGITADWFGTIPAVVIGGIGTLVVVGVWMRLFPPLRKIDRLADAANAPVTIARPPCRSGRVLGDTRSPLGEHHMTLKVVGAGFGRTGTRSLKEALEILGLGPCHHMMEVFMHPEQVPFWDRAALGEKVDWNEVFANYKSACDWPSCTFYKELADVYPHAKVILSLRDPRSWYKSVASTIMPSKNEGSRLPGIFGPLLLGKEDTFNNDFSEAHMIDGL